MDDISRCLSGLASLKRRFRAGYDSNLDFFSGILLSRKPAAQLIDFDLKRLEPLEAESKLLHTITVPLDGRWTLLYAYLGHDEDSIDSFCHAIKDVEPGLLRFPADLLVVSEIPSCLNHRDRVLFTWTSLLYSAAWKYNDVCLRAALEFQPTISNFEFSPWRDHPMSASCDPRPWMTLASGHMASRRRAEKKFAANHTPWPDVLYAHLSVHRDDDMHRSSIAAIDLLSNEIKTLQVPAEPRKPLTRNAIPLSREQAQQPEIQKYFLLRMLYEIHVKQGRQTPLTQQELANALNCSQSTASRRMRDFFPGGQQKYIAQFVNGNVRRGVFTQLYNENRTIDGISFDDSCGADDDVDSNMD